MARQKDNQAENWISYIRKPMAVHSYPCIGLAAAGFILGGAGMAFSVRTQGNMPLWAAALCFCSLLLSVAALFYGRKSLKEEEKNYILARIGMFLAGLLVIWWLVMIMLGIKR